MYVCGLFPQPRCRILEAEGIPHTASSILLRLRLGSPKLRLGFIEKKGREGGERGQGRQQGSLSRGEATQISPFANHSGYRVESTSEAVRGKQGSQLQVEECHNNTRQFGGGLDQGVNGFETC